MCNNNTKLTTHDILLNITQSEEEARKFLNKGRKRKGYMGTSWSTGLGPNGGRREMRSDNNSSNPSNPCS